MTIDYATVEEVNQRRAGDDPDVSATFDQSLGAKITEVSRDLDRMIGAERGASGEFTIVAAATASSRTFYPKAGSADVWPIDDCIEISSVSLVLSPGTSAQALVSGTDYVPIRSRGVIVALRRVGTRWPAFPASLITVARWGLMAAVSADLREVTILEVIRSFLGDRAGNDDRIGMTPFGAIVTAKAYTSKVNKLVADLRYGAGGLR